MVLSYSIINGIGIGLLSYVIMSALAYLLGLIKYAIKKDEKPVWDVSVVAIIIFLLFCAYFFIPKTLF